LRDDAGARGRALLQGEDGEGTALRRQLNQKIKALRHRDGEAAGLHRFHPMSVDGDQRRGQRARVDVKLVLAAPLMRRSLTRPPLVDGETRIFQVRPLARKAS